MKSDLPNLHATFRTIALSVLANFRDGSTIYDVGWPRRITVSTKLQLFSTPFLAKTFSKIKKSYVSIGLHIKHQEYLYKSEWMNRITFFFSKCAPDSSCNSSLSSSFLEDGVAKKMCFEGWIWAWIFYPLSW